MKNDQDFSKAFQKDTPIPQDPLPEVTANRIRTMIQDGRLSPGSRFPNELELAEAMGVSRGTIRASLHLLQQQGLIWRRQGVGTFVSEQPILENRLDMNLSVTDMIRSMGLEPGCQELEIKLITADEHLAEQLNVQLESPLIYIRRIRTANDKPVIASVDIIAQDLLQQGQRTLDRQSLEAALQQEHSIYSVLKEYLRINIEYGIARLRPIKADAQTMRQLKLDLPPGAVMLYLEQIDYDRDQRPVMVSYEYHVADSSTFSVFRR